LAGCAVGPNYKRPNVTAPSTFRGSTNTAQQVSFADLPWWEIFHDETLIGLIKESLANNYDLSVAVARVEQANQVAAQARAEYLDPA
jgi:multidrug efflux system outer membrane protein